MIELKTQNQRIATDGKQIFALFPDGEACSHCSEMKKYCMYIAPELHGIEPMLPRCDSMDDELGNYGTWKVIG